MRDLPSDEGELGPDYLEAYDRRTLFYDVFFVPEGNRVVIVCPNLKKTLTRIIKHAVFEIDHTKSTHGVTHPGGRTSQISISCNGSFPKEIKIHHPRLPDLGPVKINRTEWSRFEGMNALVAVSKNNKLDWIRDWLVYHVNVHGANAAVLFDNGSDLYTSSQLQDVISTVPGIAESAVISAPLPFGPRGHSRIHHNARFFQLSMLHIAQERFLKKANAVLSVDIDELVLSPNGKSVFDAVKMANNGFISMSGKWVYALQPGDENTVRHFDHVFQMKKKDSVMSPKWCVNPQGPLEGEYWRLHGVCGAERDFSLGYRFLHCRQITTSWDYERDYVAKEDLERSSEADFLERAFLRQPIHQG